MNKGPADGLNFVGTQPMSLEPDKSLNLPLCKECGGRCCQSSPGVWIDPERFFAVFPQVQHLTVEQLRERLPELGLVLWEKAGVPIPAPRSVDSGCVFLGPEGCLFSLADRPCQCLALIPVKETLDQYQGCLCREPEGFRREAGRLRWHKYWQSV